ncbi:hypothetical protein ACFOEE_17150 [Pseudoalteromonas fenneropenaei]|uniref:Uncharacterized protein n=1 Tax=Pseudoalteromonas fenneropenaei TaxID=1737459 RepID=A0ABV7CP05_9GAMM
MNAFIAQMPIELNEVERLRAAKILARAYERWYLDRDAKNIRIIGVTFSDIKEKHQFNAEQEARVNVRTSSGQNRKTSFCKFIKNAAGWFLTKLP